MGTTARSKTRSTSRTGAARAGAKAKKKAVAKRKAVVKKAPRCKLCGSVIRVPQGWTIGPAVRRHYWSKHRDHMMPKKASS